MPTECMQKFVHNNENQSSSFFTSVSVTNNRSKKKKKKKNAKKNKTATQSSGAVIQRPNSDISMKTENTRSLFSRCDTLESFSSTKLPSIKSQAGVTPRMQSPMRVIPVLSRDSVPVASERRKKLPLLAAIKPENEKSEKERFMRANFLYNPYFIYRFPADADVLQRSSQPSDRFLSQAIHIMETVLERYGSYEEFEAQTGGQILTRPQIMSIVKRYLKREDLEDDIVLNLTEELLSRGSMTRYKGKAQLNVRIVNLREMWVEGLLRHELGTHFLRSVNNKDQPWYNWKVRKDMGLGPMNPTEEGLASLHSVLLRKDPCLWRCALLYYTVYQAAHMSLKDLFSDLGKYVKDPNVRWDYCIRAKRGQTDTTIPGAFCKDQVYLDGALQLLKNRRQIDFQMLIRLGKVDWKDIDMLQEHAFLSETRIPFFMEDLKQYRKHLDRIAEANGLTEEIMASV